MFFLRGWGAAANRFDFGYMPLAQGGAVSPFAGAPTGRTSHNRVEEQHFSL
jgi:hypothetical protein